MILGRYLMVSRVRRRLVRAASGAALASALLLAGFATAGPAAAGPAAGETGPVRLVPGATPVKDSYLVMLKDKAAIPATAGALTSRHGGAVRAVWQHAAHGFAASMTADQAARVAADPRVAFVQQDSVVSALDTQSPAPSWGLDRVDQRNRPLDGSFTYPATTPAVSVYVIDTGVRLSHVNFLGRPVVWGANTIDANNSDCGGHGTHVAGTAAGGFHGVAKNVRLVAVKVLGCTGSGTSASVVGGVDWVTANAVRPAVANMSLGARGGDPAIDAAVRGSIQAGISYVVSAGNDNADACATSPARVGEAVTVAATDINDNRSGFSNFGPCVDIFAPGTGIVSGWHTGDLATNTLDGTSMAAPHVTGAVAMYLTTNPGATPATVQAALAAAATPRKVVNGGLTTPNHLLHVPPLASNVIVRHPGDLVSIIGDQVGMQLSVFGGTGSYTWSASNLPTGVAINPATGLITGRLGATPNGFTMTTVTASGGGVGSVTFRWQVTRDICPTC
jgi:subtilisin family serine protease